MGSSPPRYYGVVEVWRLQTLPSIKLLAALFDIPTPKDDIDGSQVAKVYWQEQDLDRIRLYCQKDTLTVAQILLKYMGKPILTEEQIEVA